MDNKKKQEDLSPEELWKKVSQQLSSKKYESVSKLAYTTMFDLTAVSAEISRVKAEKLSEIKGETTKGDAKGDTKGDTKGAQPVSQPASQPDKQAGNDPHLIEIENSLLNIPHFKEIEPKYPLRRKAKIPSFFPKHSFMHFGNPNFYKKFDLDTLFFVFYYFKGYVQQTYAAIRLKHYAWRYHLKYKMWFQRLDEPKLITSEYERGEFLFFDYETTWNFMKKNDFVFEYFYLEHNDYY